MFAPLRSFLDADAVAAAARAIAPALSDSEVEVTGQRIDAPVSEREIAELYAPLSAYLRRLARGRERVMAAVAGPPGSGKSLLASRLVRAVAALDGEERLNPVWLGLDGFHYPEAVLAERVVEVDGAPVRLKLYKGAEFTFDAAAAKAKFAEIRNGAGRPALAPAYDRRRHEPVEDAVLIPGDSRLVIVEGNYLLLDEGPWAGMPELFDRRIYIDMSLADCRPGLLARHIRGGRSRRDAERHHALVDARNHRVIEATKGRADIVVRKSARHELAEVLAARFPDDVRL